MSRDKEILRKVAAGLGTVAVALGALGGHPLTDFLTIKGSYDTWQTATKYLIFHATTILTIALSSNDSRYSVQAGQLMAVGTILFSGSLYIMALDVGPKFILVPMTPLGGVLMLAGWVMTGLN